jgi:hypothetical protein
MSDDTSTELLLAAYADDPHSLRPDERARVEAWLAEAGDAELTGLRATVTEVRALDGAGTPPDWPQLEAQIFAATTRATRARWPWLVAGGLALAAAAVVALMLRAPASGALLATWQAPAVNDDARPTVDEQIAIEDDEQVAIDDELDAVAIDEVIDDDQSDLDGMGPMDDELLDAVIAFEDDSDSDDDLPGSGATWTGWLDDLSDAELDRAMAWLDDQEQG